MIREILTTQLLVVRARRTVQRVLSDDPGHRRATVRSARGCARTRAGRAGVASLRSLRDLSQRTVVAKSDEQSCLVELMKGIAYIKASGAEQRAYDRWATLFRRQLGVFVERSYLTAKVEVALGVARAASPLVLLWYGAYLVRHRSVAARDRCSRSPRSLRRSSRRSCRSCRTRSSSSCSTPMSNDLPTSSRPSRSMSDSVCGDNVECPSPHGPNRSTRTLISFLGRRADGR